MSIWAKITGFLGIVVAALFGVIERLKRKEAEEDAEREKSARIAKDEATEALIRGTTNESNTTDNPRDYKF